MTPENVLTCPNCSSADIELVSDNGAEFPQTRVEFYLCNQCRNRFKKVLSV